MINYNALILSMFPIICFLDFENPCMYRSRVHFTNCTCNDFLLPYILVYKSNFLDVKVGSKNRPRLIFGRT